MKAAKIFLMVVAVWCGCDSVVAQTWTQQTNAPGGIVVMASLADGSILAAASHTQIYSSTNSVRLG